jgi:membrane protein DedA with SNARE-associated domain
VIAPDLPGFGGSSRVIPDYANRAQARYLLQLLDSLHIPSAHLLGFSMGGGVVMEAAGLAPERVHSLTLLSAVGAQEYELLGDYHLNHLIHGLQLGSLWLLREGTPHFGRLNGATLGVSYARTYYDTDQRPLRGILQNYPGPMLILHGERDAMVSPAVAREHARIVPQAELELDDGEHTSPVTHPERVATRIVDFVQRAEAGTALTRTTAAPARLAAAAVPFDPRTLPRLGGVALGILCLIIALSTMISEDLTCITTGLMIARGTIGFLTGTLACFTGIFVGDLLVFLAGRSLGRAVIGRAPVRWFITPEAVAWSSAWIQRRGAVLVFATRVLPGTRLPTYFAAGMLRTSLTRFAAYFFVACAIWTPILVGISAAFGEATQHALSIFRERMALYLFVTALVLFLLLKLLIPLATWRGRRLLLSRWRRLTHWVYWPRWLVSAPVALHVLWLALKHRSLLLVTAANPGIAGGGLFAESKTRNLAGLGATSACVTPFALIPATLSGSERQARASAFQRTLATPWPLVLKPDVGKGGSGVVIARSETAVADYLARATVDTIVQEYAPGEEFAVCYVRMPGESRGRIISMTAKRFPALMADGERSFEELLLSDDEAIGMAPIFLRRHVGRLAEIPPAGERLPLVELGCRSHGAVYHDAGGIITPALTEAIDQLSRGFEGFWFGQFDIRTPSVPDFQAGRNFRVLELNGVSAEASSIYDPRKGLGDAYRTLGERWRSLFAIAAANVALGARPATAADLWRLLRRRGNATPGRG